MNLVERFVNPPPECRPLAGWLWSHRLDPAVLRWQIEQMAEKGLGGFVIRPGALAAFPGPGWFEGCWAAAACAREAGLAVWADDQFFIGPQDLRRAGFSERSERRCLIRLEEQIVNGPAVLIFDENVVVAYLDRPGGEVERLYSPHLHLGPGAHRVRRIVREDAQSPDGSIAPDPLRPSAISAFMQLTHEAHADALGEAGELGVTGFLTRGAGLGAGPGFRLPWTASFPDDFLLLKGYEILDHLYKLFEPEEEAPLRFDFWDTTARLLERAFLQPVDGWCREHHLGCAAAFTLPEPPSGAVRASAAPLAALRRLPLPALLAPGPAALHLAAAAAALAHRRAVMVDLPAAGAWGAGIPDLKRTLERLALCGADTAVFNTFHLTIAGPRKRESPPSHFTQCPQWPWFGALSVYAARLSALLGAGHDPARIAVLFPQSALWIAIAPDSLHAQSLDESFTRICARLDVARRGFLVIDEIQLAGAGVEDRGLTISGHRFEALILPNLSWIRRDALQVLQQFGHLGRVLLDGGGVLHGITDDGAVESADPASWPCITRFDAADPASLEAALAFLPPDLRVDDAPELRCRRRSDGDRQVFLLANFSDAPLDAEAWAPVSGAAEWWDPATGAMMPACDQRAVDDGLSMSLRLPAQSLRALVVDTSKPVLGTQAAPFHPERRFKVCAGRWHFTPYGGNFHRFTQWDLSVEPSDLASVLHYRTRFVLTEDIANLRLILDGLPPPPEAADPAATHAVILLDNHPLSQTLPWEIDPYFRVAGMGGRCKAGTHHLEIRIAAAGAQEECAQALSECVWLAGDFLIEAGDGAPRLSCVRGISIGPWETQGFPSFSGTGAYAADVTLPADLEGKRVYLDAGRVGGIFEAEINGHIFVCAWPPCRVEVTHAVRPGPDNIFVLKVTNTLRNLLLGPDPARPSGLLDEVWLEIG